jgi:hypothetical protein
VFKLRANEAGEAGNVERGVVILRAQYISDCFALRLRAVLTSVDPSCQRSSLNLCWPA